MAYSEVIGDAQLKAKYGGLAMKSQSNSQELDKILDFWKGDIAVGFKPLCSYCGTKSRKVVGQTAKGIDAQINNHLPRNWGYYCQRCYDEGTKEENEAIYG